MGKVTLALFILCLLILGCTSTSSSDNYSAVFLHPQDYVGKQVHLCGYIRDDFEDKNIWVSRRAMKKDGAGLGFISDRRTEGPGQWNDQTRCVTGEIVRTGCAQENICSWSNFPYALKVIGDENRS